jgi:hypothetical protein
MDKLDYFLFLKTQYTSILYNLKDIHNTYNEILESHTTKGLFLEYEIDQKNRCEKQINEIEYYIQQIKNQISNRCNHNLVEDEIDITPEKSQKIKYCSECEYTYK